MGGLWFVNHVGYSYMASAIVYAYASKQVVNSLDAAITGGTATVGDFAVVVAGSAVTISGVQIGRASRRVTVKVPVVAVA